MLLSKARVSTEEVEELYLNLWKTICELCPCIEIGGGGTFLVFELAGRIAVAKRRITLGRQDAEFQCATDMADILNWLAGVAAGEAPIHHLMTIAPVRDDEGSMVWLSPDRGVTFNSAQIVAQLEKIVRRPVQK